MKIIEDIKRSLDRNLMSASVRKVLEEEEENGAIIANKFRYIFFLFIIIGGIANIFTIDSPELRREGLKIYLYGLFMYLFITIIHTFVLKKKNLKLNITFGYITLIADYSVLTAMMLAWYHLQSPNNFNYFLKNPSMMYYFLMFILTLIQIRIRLVIAGSVIFLAIHFISLIYGLIIEVKTAESWVGHVLGDSVYIADLLTARPIVFICVSLAVGYSIYRTIYMVRRIGTIEAEKKSLSKYFSPDIVEEITKNPEVLNRGKRQEVTILFQDIRDFTKMSEKMQADDLAEFLNEFRKRMTNVIFANGGTLDKYIGDAIMATFGTPTVSENDTLNAVNAGKQMLSSLKEWNIERKREGKSEIRIGIGLHCGEVFTGNIGFEDRMEYTVIGDAVNTASRIESLCKQFQAEFLISDEVYQKVKENIQVEKLSPVEVKGKEKALQIYKVLL